MADLILFELFEITILYQFLRTMQSGLSLAFVRFNVGAQNFCQPVSSAHFCHTDFILCAWRLEGVKYIVLCRSVSCGTSFSSESIVHRFDSHA